jgi:hypothetical protein
MSHTISLAVRNDGPARWVIEHTDAALITRTSVAYVATAPEALRVAERKASGDVLWRVTGDGFEAVVHSHINGWPL